MFKLPEIAPPLLETRGDHQTFEYLRQSDDFYAAWQGVNLPSEYWTQSKCNHFDELFPLAESDSELTNKNYTTSNS